MALLINKHENWLLLKNFNVQDIWLIFNLCKVNMKKDIMAMGPFPEVLQESTSKIECMHL